MAATLRDLKVKFVSLVDRGANFDPKTGDGAHILLYKRHVEKDQPGVGGVHVDSPDLKAKKPSSTSKEPSVTKPNVIKQFFATLAKMAGPLADWARQEETEPQHGDLAKLKAHHEALGKAIDGMGDATKLPADHPVHALKALHKELGDSIAAKEAAMAPPAEGEPEIDECADPGMMKRDAIAKAERLELTKRIEAAEKRATDAETIAKGELEKREVGELRTQLAKFRNLTIDVDKEVADFRSIQKADPKAFGLLIAKLAAADVIAAKGDALDVRRLTLPVPPVVHATNRSAICAWGGTNAASDVVWNVAEEPPEMTFGSVPIAEKA